MPFFQNIIDHVYRYPKARQALYKRFGGYRQYQEMAANEDAMRNAAEAIPPMDSFANGLQLYFLTGKKYLHQTLFCIRSLVKVTAQNFKFYIVDDGTFDDAFIARIRKQLPGAEIITSNAISTNLDGLLSATKYPLLRAKRQVYPHLRKLTDIHTIPGEDWKLVLDSDMLFWRKPTEMLHWLSNPPNPIHMVDCMDSYGYSKKLMQSLTNYAIPDRLNVGAIGLKSSAIDWTRLNDWIGELETAGGTSYYLEQALTAMLIGSRPCTVLNEDAYKVNPAPTDDECILKHYVDVSKKLYYNQDWKKIFP